MYFELFISRRHLKAKRKQALISIITLISMLGVMIGVMALIVVLSVANGFRSDWVSKILGVNGHILVGHYGGSFNNYQEILKEINTVEGVTATTPSIYCQVLINSYGAMLRGLDTASAPKMINIKPMITQGTLSSLDNLNDGLPAIIIGCELAKHIGVLPGDVLTVISTGGEFTPLGSTLNRRNYRVSGLFDSGYYEYDLYMAFVSLKESQDLLGIQDQVTSIEAKVKDPYQSDSIVESVKEVLGSSYYVQDWKARNRNLLSFLKLFKVTMFIILTLIVLVGALNIIGSLVMLVMEKTGDIAILRAMGATKKGIMYIFIFQGLLVGVLGTIAGLLSGLGICHILSKYKFIELPSDIYNISTLPVMVESLDVILVTLSAVIISFLATIYPSWYAAKLNPVEVLRYE